MDRLTEYTVYRLVSDLLNAAADRMLLHYIYARSQLQVPTLLQEALAQESLSYSMKELTIIMLGSHRLIAAAGRGADNGS